jgi:hypothetical protein
MIPPGGIALPAKSAFRFDPVVPTLAFQPQKPVTGFLIGLFGKSLGHTKATHALIVNLDYQADQSVGIGGPGKVERFDPTTLEWSGGESRHANLKLSPGGGVLIRLRQ